jgi:5-(carboxyamino)imidazole ribonucleotide synthase
MSIELKTLPPAATTTLGVMGGGQLGRMFVHAAQSLGFRTLVLDPDEASPAGLVAHEHIRADYLDEAALARMAAACDAITTEFENVPAQALDFLAHRKPVAPAGRCVAICQDRAAEKAHFGASGVACAPYAVIASQVQLDAVDAALLPGILKTARMGYDGKGQIRVKTREELVAAWDELKRVPCVLEQMLPLALELSVIVARGGDGVIVHFPVQQNLHRDGILAVTEVPAPAVSPELAVEATTAAARIASEMAYVGVLCIEFFVLQDGRLVVNEMAPRPHNSGHYTLNACDVSQFELQARAMAGLPLNPPRLHSPTVMLNLLGDLWFDEQGQERTPAWDRVLAIPGTHLHLYGKTSARKGRKMGHLNVTGASADEARQRARAAAAVLGLPTEW